MFDTSTPPPLISTLLFEYKEFDLGDGDPNTEEKAIKDSMLELINQVLETLAAEEDLKMLQILAASLDVEQVIKEKTSKNEDNVFTFPPDNKGPLN